MRVFNILRYDRAKGVKGNEENISNNYIGVERKIENK